MDQNMFRPVLGNVLHVQDGTSVGVLSVACF